MGVCVPFQSALGWDHQSELSKHASQTDAVKGFGGKFGVQKDHKDKVVIIIIITSKPLFTRFTRCPLFRGFSVCGIIIHLRHHPLSLSFVKFTCTTSASSPPPPPFLYPECSRLGLPS